MAISSPVPATQAAESQAKRPCGFLLRRQRHDHSIASIRNGLRSACGGGSWSETTARVSWERVCGASLAELSAFWARTLLRLWGNGL